MLNYKTNVGLQCPVMPSLSNRKAGQKGKGRLRELGLFNLEKRLVLRAPSSTKKGFKRAGQGLLRRAWSDRTRGN